MTHLEQQLKEFKKEFPAGLYFADLSLNPIFVIPQTEKVRQFLIQSHINYLQSEIERLNGEMESDKPEQYEFAIQDQISHLKKQIINANKLL